MNCGIYAIVHVQTGFRYIGMSRRIKERRNEHLRLLKAGKHHCKRLQLAWKNHGGGAFVFRGVESIAGSATEEFLLRRERAWRARYHPLLFNPLKGQNVRPTPPPTSMQFPGQRDLDDLRGFPPAAARSRGRKISPPRAEERRNGMDRRRTPRRRADD